MPSRSETERKGIMFCSHSQEASPLLFVVYCGAFDFLALGISSTRRDRAGLAIRRHDDSAGDRNLSVFFDGQPQRAIVNLLVRARIRTRVAGHRIVFAVELARPLAVYGLPVAGCAINRDFYIVPRGFKDDCVVLRHARSHFRLGLIQFPGTHLGVAGETYGPCYQAQCKSQYTRSCFHVASMANKCRTEFLWD